MQFRPVALSNGEEISVASISTIFINMRNAPFHKRVVIAVSPYVVKLNNHVTQPPQKKSGKEKVLDSFCG
ncbi:MAG: hypothetical protein M0Z99_11450 [Betaproteobacteria bacterium]|nr:hypothetical protein [Betaproteobacteria bacterium]